MRIEKTLARSASEQRPRRQNVGVRKDMRSGVLFPNGSAASLALELPVEGVERFPLRVELVRVSFDGFPGQGGVHLNERHGQTVERDAEENKRCLAR